MDKLDVVLLLTSISLFCTFVILFLLIFVIAFANHCINHAI